MEMDFYHYTDATRGIHALLQRLEQKKNTFRPFTVKLSLIKDKVSRNQQCFIFGVLYPAIKAQLIEMGYDAYKTADEDEFHNAMKSLFYYREFPTKTGFIKVPKTLKLGKGNKQEVHDYIEDLLKFAAQIGVYIQTPTEDWYIV